MSDSVFFEPPLAIRLFGSMDVCIGGEQCRGGIAQAQGRYAEGRAMTAEEAVAYAQGDEAY
jgi:hypothetical protein